MVFAHYFVGSQSQTKDDSTQSSKRSRLADSDSDSDNESRQPTKKARIVDSDSDDSDKPLSTPQAGKSENLRIKEDIEVFL